MRSRETGEFGCDGVMQEDAASSCLSMAWHPARRPVDRVVDRISAKRSTASQGCAGTGWGALGRRCRGNGPSPVTGAVSARPAHQGWSEVHPVDRVMSGCSLSRHSTTPLTESPAEHGVRFIARNARPRRPDMASAFRRLGVVWGCAGPRSAVPWRSYRRTEIPPGRTESTPGYRCHVFI